MLRYINMKFSRKWINQALTELNIQKLNDIQEKTIPIILDQKNVICVSQTGSGKTFCLLLPILEKLDLDLNELQVIVLIPTRELARQIYSNVIFFKKFNSNLKVSLLIGGQDKKDNFHNIIKNHILISTPQRFLDFLNKNTNNLSSLKVIAIDEADMMMDQNFSDLLINGFSKIKNIDNVQKLAFSATLHEKLSLQLSKFFKNTEIVVDKKDIWVNKKIKHHIIHLDSFAKEFLLEKLVTSINPFFCVIFCNTKNEVEKIFTLVNSIFPNEVLKLHGDLPIRERKNTFKEIANFSVKFLVATDLASRGINVSGSSHIVSWNMPKEDIWYIHRSGRTGRGALNGDSYVFLEITSKPIIMRLQKKGIVWDSLKFSKDNFISFQYRLKPKTKRKMTEVDLEIQKIIREAPKKKKPNCKKKIALKISEVKRKAKRQRIEELVNKERIKKYKIENAKKKNNHLI